jgi:hypothetical protein
MGDIIPLRKNPHEEVQVLLPWFVNGSLAADEAERVEAHRAACAECRSDLGAERQLAAAVAQLSFECDGAWERMRELLTRDAGRSVGRWLRKRVRISWTAAAPLAAAAALALVFASVTPKQTIEPQYRALSAGGAAQQANLIVQFEPSTRVEDVQRLLALSKARLVDGPTVTGAYLLRVDQRKRELALEKLRNDEAVSLAEPIDAPPGT